MKAVALLFLALLCALPARAADSYLPAGAFSYDTEVLPNGLRIVSQRVSTAPYVSARLVTRVGTDHFPCADRELPHLVEHLLFSANTVLDEAAIDEQVSRWGGSINAYTYPEQTDVVLDVHADFQADAMQLLATLAGAFAPQDSDVARERRVVEHESGTVQTPLRLWWARQPFTWAASTHFSIDAGLLCDGGITPVAHLTRERVQQAFDTYYVPANMILVLVGDLDAEGLAAAREAFGALPARARPPLQPARIAMPPEGRTYESGWLSGTAQLDQPSAWGLSTFHDWRGYYALLLVESWLNDRMFRELRGERGVTYTPEAVVRYEGSALSVSLTVQTAPEDTAFVEEYLRTLVATVRDDGIPEEDFERLRLSTLLGMAQAFERIADRADYLAASVREIDEGALFDSERFYRDLDYATFRQLVSRDWPMRFVVADDSPRLAWGTVTGLLGASLVLLATGCALLVWRHWRRRREAVRKMV